MTIEQGLYKQTRLKRQSAKGTLAGTSDGQILRRETSTFELQKDSYNTASEITSHQQLASNRHGARLVPGSVQGILSPGTYSDIMAAVLRRDFAAVSAITGASITVAGSGPTYTLTRGSGSFLTDGVKIGMGVRLTAGSFDSANLNKNLLVTAVTALVVTVLVMNGSALVAEGPVTGSTVTIPGKVTYTPTTGHTKIYHTVEEWHPTITRSEVFRDVQFGTFTASLPGSGNAKFTAAANGLDLVTPVGSSAYFTSPAAETTTGALVGASGALLVDGTQQAVITDLELTANGNPAPADPVVGRNVRPDVFRGIVLVTGRFTAYLEDGAITDQFINESASSIVSAACAGDEAAAEFMTMTMSKVKVTSATPDDVATGLKRTYQFTAELNTAGGAALATQLTTLQVQDSQAA